MTFAQTCSPECLPLISEIDVEQIIKTLKNNKATDGCGVSAEHLKYWGEEVVYLLKTYEIS